MSIVRSEKSSAGAIDVPTGKLWGVQTQHSLEYFRISTEKTPTLLIHVLALAECATTKVNEDLGLLSEEKVSAIRQAADEVLAGQYDDRLPLAIWQTGSGTQSDMNMNEVLADQASELLGGVRGMERKVHPNDDVNKNQSSNDVFPTMMHVVAPLALRKQLIPQLKALTQTLSERSHAFADTVKIGRTHLRGVTPLTLEQEISGRITMLEHNLRHIEYSLPHVAELALGGTAVSTGLDTHPKYMRRVADELAVITCAPFVTAPNKFKALTTCDALVQAHSTLKGLAASLMKIANDVRWLASGPHCRIGEILVPGNESGSSIVPGKVNPMQRGASTILCCQVMGGDVAINMGGASGSFELNIFRPIAVHDFLQSVRLLAGGMESFNKHCAVGIEPNRGRINQLLSEPPMLVAALSTHISYDKAAEIAEKTHKEGLTLRAAALALGYLNKVELDRWVRPEQVVGSMKTGG